MTKRTYTPEEKGAALKLAAAEGLAVAAKQLDMPKSTLKTWASKADVVVASAELVAKTQAATVQSVVSRQQKIAECKDELTELLAAVAVKSVRVQMTMLEMGENRLDHVVGAGTRAIHDLQLLEGNATEIVEELDVASMARLRDEIRARMPKQ